MSEFEFTRFIQETPAIVLVGGLAIVVAFLLLVYALLYHNVGALRDWLAHVVTALVPYAGLQTLSVFAWQFVTRETGLWLLVLVGTPFEAFTGLLLHRRILKVVSQDPVERFVGLSSALVFYVPFIALLTWVGANTYAEIAALLGNQAHPLVFFLLWVGLAILAWWVGKATYWYIVKQLLPMFEQWEKRKVENDAEENQKRVKLGQETRVETDRQRAVNFALIHLKSQWLWAELYQSQLRNDLAEIARDLKDEELENARQASWIIAGEYRRRTKNGILSPYRRDHVIRGAVIEILAPLPFLATQEFKQKVTQEIEAIFETYSERKLKKDPEEIMALLVQDYYAKRRGPVDNQIPPDNGKVGVANG